MEERKERTISGHHRVSADSFETAEAKAATVGEKEEPKGENANEREKRSVLKRGKT